MMNDHRLPSLTTPRGSLSSSSSSSSPPSSPLANSPHEYPPLVEYVAVYALARAVAAANAALHSQVQLQGANGTLDDAASSAMGSGDDEGDDPFVLTRRYPEEDHLGSPFPGEQLRTFISSAKLATELERTATFAVCDGFGSVFHCACCSGGGDRVYVFLSRNNNTKFLGEACMVAKTLGTPNVAGYDADYPALEAYLRHLVERLPPPSGNRVTKVMLPPQAGGALVVPPSIRGGLPPAPDEGVQRLMDIFDVDGTTALFEALALEDSVVLHTKQTFSSLLSSTCEALRSLLYPFYWQGVYVPNLVLRHDLLGRLFSRLGSMPILLGISTSETLEVLRPPPPPSAAATGNGGGGIINVLDELKMRFSTKEGGGGRVVFANIDTGVIEYLLPASSPQAPLQVGSTPSHSASLQRSTSATSILSSVSSVSSASFNQSHHNGNPVGSPRMTHGRSANVVVVNAATLASTTPPKTTTSVSHQLSSEMRRKISERITTAKVRRSSLSSATSSSAASYATGSPSLASTPGEWLDVVRLAYLECWLGLLQGYKAHVTAWSSSSSSRREVGFDCEGFLASSCEAEDFNFLKALLATRHFGDFIVRSVSSSSSSNSSSTTTSSSTSTSSTSDSRFDALVRLWNAHSALPPAARALLMKRYGYSEREARAVWARVRHLDTSDYAELFSSKNLREFLTNIGKEVAGGSDGGPSSEETVVEEARRNERMESVVVRESHAGQPPIVSTVVVSRGGGGEEDDPHVPPLLVPPAPRSSFFRARECEFVRCNRGCARSTHLVLCERVTDDEIHSLLCRSNAPSGVFYAHGAWSWKPRLHLAFSGGSAEIKASLRGGSGAGANGSASYSSSSSVSSASTAASAASTNSAYSSTSSSSSSLNGKPTQITAATASTTTTTTSSSSSRVKPVPALACAMKWNQLQLRRVAVDANELLAALLVEERAGRAEEARRQRAAAAFSVSPTFSNSLPAQSFPNGEIAFPSELRAAQTRIAQLEAKLREREAELARVSSNVSSANTVPLASSSTTTLSYPGESTLYATSSAAVRRTAPLFSNLGNGAASTLTTSALAAPPRVPSPAPSVASSGSALSTTNAAPYFAPCSSPLASQGSGLKSFTSQTQMKPSLSSFPNAASPPPSTFSGTSGNRPSPPSTTTTNTTPISHPRHVQQQGQLHRSLSVGTFSEASSPSATPASFEPQLSITAQNVRQFSMGGVLPPTQQQQPPVTPSIHRGNGSFASLPTAAQLFFESPAPSPPPSSQPSVSSHPSPPPPSSTYAGKSGTTPTATMATSHNSVSNNPSNGSSSNNNNNNATVGDKEGAVAPSSVLYF